MGNYIKDEQFKLIKEYPENLIKIENQFEDVCLEAIKKWFLYNKDKKATKFIW